MFTERQMVSDGNTKHFDGSYLAYIWQNQWSSVVRLSSAVSDDNFNWFSFVELLFLWAQSATCSSSLTLLRMLQAGITIYVSLAYLIILLPGVTVDKPDALMTKETGPTADPCMMLAVMRWKPDTSLLNLVQCVWSLKNSTSQLYTGSRIFSKAIFLRNFAWRTVSKALLKSNAMTKTYGFLDSMSLMVCSKVMRAAVVEPVGQNANWSLKWRAAGGISIAGYRNVPTTTRSRVLQRTGVIQIGRKSECWTGAEFLGTGRIDALFHCRGTTDV